MLHPDAPDEAKADPEEYAKWRVQNMDAEDHAAMADLDLEQSLQFFRDEFYDALDVETGYAEIESAEVEARIEREKGTPRH